MTTSRVSTRIIAIEQRRNSGNGNLQFSVDTTSGSFRTAPDAQVAFGIANPEYRGEVILTLESGRIVGIATPDGSVFTGRQS